MEIWIDETFNDRARAKQLLSFTGLKSERNIRPTDIDGIKFYESYEKISGLIERRKNLFIFFEGKVKGIPLTIGQKLCFESICDCFFNLNYLRKEYLNLKKVYTAVFIIHFEHEVPSEGDVKVKDQYVKQIYNNIDLVWREPSDVSIIPNYKIDSDGLLTVGEAIEQIYEWCKEEGIII